MENSSETKINNNNDLTAKTEESQNNNNNNVDEYVEKNENKGFDDLIKIELNDKNHIKKFKMFCKKNSFIIKERAIGEYYIGERKCTLCSPVSGKIVHIDDDNYKIIIERCKHDQTYVNLCVYCGYDIR